MLEEEAEEDRERGWSHDFVVGMFANVDSALDEEGMDARVTVEEIREDEEGEREARERATRRRGDMTCDTDAGGGGSVRGRRVCVTPAIRLR